ncbi:MAG: general secretion pathway protein GspK [Candidatus Marinimicrobia bacterium]|nr:general secretion pathway protein GspK [Candidatus Neomarinimicrobiota bacterium]
MRAFVRPQRRVPNRPDADARRRGVALVVTLWAILLLTLLVGSFAFNMHIEARIASYYRKRTRAQYLARAGIEYAMALLAHREEVGSDDFADDFFEDQEPDPADSSRRGAYQLQRGLAVNGLRVALSNDVFVLDIIPEEGRRNINRLTDEEWEEILDQGGVPEEDWPRLIDCFHDWVDEDEFTRLSGAESDDPFYKERGYPVKNAPLDLVDELLMIKGFSPAIVFGGPAAEPDAPLHPGIASLLTVFGDGRVNVNTATRQVLLTLPGLEPWMADEIIEGRLGLDQREGTKDDGFDSVGEVMARVALPPTVRERLTVREVQFLRVSAVGETQGVRSGVWCVLRVAGGQVTPVFWREETLR